MSDSAGGRAASPATPRPHGIRQWPLRRQLVLSVVLILVAVIAVIGAVSVVAQRQSLISRLDDQLRTSLQISERAAAPGSPGAGEGPGSGPTGSGGLPGPQLGGLTVIEEDGRVVAAQLVDESGDVYVLGTESLAALREAGGTAASPAEVDLGDHGVYRVAARQDGDLTVIAGQSLAEVSQTTRDLVLTFSLVALIAVILGALAARFLVRLGLRPLDRLASAASRVSATPLASGSVTLSERVPEGYTAPGTEVGQVGAAFNQMLDHVERSLQIRQESEERLRRFVADASHELRTPLAAISGYTELASRRAPELPEDVGRSLERIGSESTRMTSLVQDLLLLARLDAGASLGEERVELARIVVDACSDARVTGPDHVWELELDEAAADIAVLGDPGRLHQVVLNLLTNARVHTPAGTTVTVRLGTAGRSYAVIRVEDDGPGIPAELQDRIFDRFVRGDDSRSRSAGSTGLGMSIVAAIVEAHRGRVDLESRPGHTMFTVTLPLA